MDKPEALRWADFLDQMWAAEPAAELRRLHAENAELLAALKAAGLSLHHAWCDVQMNDYSFEKLNQTMIVVDAAIAKAEEQK